MPITTSRRPRTLLAAGLLAAGLALAMTACSGGGNASGGSADFTGTWGEDAQGKPSLTLTSDKSLTGTDGCNRLNGDFKVEGDKIVFGPVASTRMACPGVDTWLLDMASAKVSGGSLEVSNADGKVIGSLKKR